MSGMKRIIGESRIQCMIRMASASCEISENTTSNNDGNCSRNGANSSIEQDIVASDSYGTISDTFPNQLNTEVGKQS